ncbi:mitochondrial carrier domain-containing protein [Aspergillus floccosus]
MASVKVAPVTPSETEKKRPARAIPPWVSLIAGGTAGGIEATITYPFEFAKTRAQLSSRSGAPTPKNPFMLIAQVVKNEGPGAIYTGCSTLVVGTTAKAAVRFLSFDTIKNLLAREDGSLSAGRGILAGMVAGATESLLAVTPTERVKTALIDDANGPKRFRSTLHATKLLVQESGISALYRGAVSTTAKQAATSAVRMGTYNFLKETVKSREISTGPVTTFGIGAIAGTVTVYATQPFDVVKTRSQSAHGAKLGEAISSVWTEFGVRGFWKGSTMRLGRLLLSGGIVFSVYEQVAQLLHGSTGK